MNKVRIGIIGIGNMGSGHARYIVKGDIKNCELTAVCDIDLKRLDFAKEELSKDIKRFKDYKKLIDSELVDAIIIAVPHYTHPQIAIYAFSKNVHVLCEKPAGSYTKQVNEMNEAYDQKKEELVFSLMYNQRTNPAYKKIKELIENNELGEIKRIVWLITNWYRPQSYYNSGGWRATWSGEGGGVLMNQDPHQIDLWQWMFGMPKRVYAFGSFGKYHDIEVEDDVTAYFEYEDKKTGVLVTSTHEAPGTNRLEVSCNRGKLVYEDNKITFYRLQTPERQFNKEFKGGFGAPEAWECKIPIEGKETAHRGITQNFVNTILGKETLIAPGIEGIKTVELINSMIFSLSKDMWVNLPIDDDEYYNFLQEKIKNSTFEKKVDPLVADTEGTY